MTIAFKRGDLIKKRDDEKTYAYRRYPTSVVERDNITENDVFIVLHDTVEISMVAKVIWKNVVCHVFYERFELLAEFANARDI